MNNKTVRFFRFFCGKNNEKNCCFDWCFSIVWFCLCWLFIFTNQVAAAKPESAQKDISRKQLESLFSKVVDQLKSDYVEDLTNRELLEGALSGMVTSLDPHSSFLSEKKFKDIRNQASGQFGGLGMEIIIEKDFVRIISPLEGTPAFQAGLKPNDQIVAIEGVPLSRMSDFEALQALRGEPGTKVSVTIFRDNSTSFDVTMTREYIKVQSVKYRLEGDVGYIRIAKFNDDTTTEVIKAVNALRAEYKKELDNDKKNNKTKNPDKKLKGLVIDLRSNPGGLLEQAVSVSSLFLPPKRDIVSIKGKDKRQVSSFQSKSSDITSGMPLVVLVNSGSASASEIVAGALQDYKRAIIVGTKTFGKGSVQRVSALDNIGALKMTVALYYTPKGRSIQKEGIEPDIRIEQQVDLQTINSDERLREAFLKDAINKDEASSKDIETKSLDINSAVSTKKQKESLDGTSSNHKKDSAKQNPKSRQFQEVNDYQLMQAINILKAISLGFKVKAES